MAKKQKNPRWLKSMVEETMNNIQSDIIKNMSSYGRNASFRSVRSLRTSVVYKDGAYTGTIHSDKSFQWMETGSGKAQRKTGGKHYFRDIIYKWLVDKGITVHTSTKRYNPNSWGSGMRRLAKLIAYRIQQRGTKLHRSHKKQDIYTSSIKNRYEELQNKAMRYLSEVEIAKSFTEQ